MSKRIVRLIQKWLAAGVLEDGRWSVTGEGTPQGATISPHLANIYLHYVLDLWVQQWRKRTARGEVIVVRYADDFVLGFQHESDATRFRVELQRRLEQFDLQVHPEKTRLLRFGMQHRSPGKFPNPSHPGMAPRLTAPEPAQSDNLGTHEPTGEPMDPPSASPSSISLGPL